MLFCLNHIIYYYSHNENYKFSYRLIRVLQMEILAQMVPHVSHSNKEDLNVNVYPDGKDNYAKSTPMTVLKNHVSLVLTALI